MRRSNAILLHGRRIVELIAVTISIQICYDKLNIIAQHANTFLFTMSRRLIYNFGTFPAHLRLQRPVSCTAHQRADKTSKIVLHKQVYNVYGIAPRAETAPLRGGWNFSAAARHNITHYAHEQYINTQQDDDAGPKSATASDNCNSRLATRRSPPQAHTV